MIKTKKLWHLIILIYLFLSSVLCDLKSKEDDDDDKEIPTLTTQILSFVDKFVAIRVSDIIKFGFSISNMIRKRRRARLQQQQLRAKSISGRIVFQENNEIEQELKNILNLFNERLNKLIVDLIEKNVKTPQNKN